MNIVSESAIHKELDLIQGCISRMAHNSFIVKGWAILLVSGVFAFGGKEVLSWWYCFIICGTLFALWVLNAYFLAKEKEYRYWYSWIIKERRTGNDTLLYELNTSKYPTGKCCPAGTMFSTILPWFYIALILTSIAAVACSYSSNNTSNNHKCHCVQMTDDGSKHK